MTWLRTGCAAFGVAMVTFAGGCFDNGDGPEPPLNTLYFPVGILPSPGGNALYVVNSDFDLQYNGGTVEVYNLHDIRDVALEPFWNPDAFPDKSEAPCFGLGLNPNVILYPGECGPLDLDHPPPRAKPYSGPIFRNAATIGAFATDLVMACQPSADIISGGTADCMRGGTADPNGARIFVPVRGDRSLTFFDVDDDRPGGEQTFKLDCGQIGHGTCSSAFAAGVDPAENTRGLVLPAEPFGIAISDRADAVVVTHQSSTSTITGFVSLFTGTETSSPADPNVKRAPILGVKPRLEYVLGGLPGSATGIAAVPTPGIDAYRGFDVTNYQPGFAVAYRLTAQVDMFRFFDDSFAAPARPYLARGAAFGLPPTPSGADSRDVTIENSPSSNRAVCDRSCAATLSACIADCASSPDRSDCEHKCHAGEPGQGGGAGACFTACTGIPLGVYVSNRAPASLLLGELRLPNAEGNTETISFFDSVPMPTGPSRVVMGRIHDRRDPPGVFRPRVFALCFDSRAVIIYDPVERRVDGQIRTGRGPHAFVMDPVHPIAYLGHFTDSYIGLVDLDQTHGSTFGTIIATISIPVTPLGTK
jgi:DNA-binding beta-propeller fold protein YncE